MWLILAAASASTFNLNCTVRTVTGLLNTTKKQSPKPTEPKVLGIRIDLDRLRWCSGECESTQAIVSVTPQEIRLQQQVDPQNGSAMGINRETGQFVEMILNKETGFTVLTTGQCEAAPFTGMPEPKF